MPERERRRRELFRVRGAAQEGEIGRRREFRIAGKRNDHGAPGRTMFSYCSWVRGKSQAGGGEWRAAVPEETGWQETTESKKKRVPNPPVALFPSRRSRVAT